jgi:hypothetical protein
VSPRPGRPNLPWIRQGDAYARRSSASVTNVDPIGPGRAGRYTLRALPDRLPGNAPENFDPAKFSQADLSKVRRIIAAAPPAPSPPPLRRSPPASRISRPICSAFYAASRRPMRFEDDRHAARRARREDGGARGARRRYTAEALSEKLAEGAGFEPAVRFPVHTLSRRAPSTTRPPLRPLMLPRRACRSGRLATARSGPRRLHRPGAVSLRRSGCKPRGRWRRRTASGHAGDGSPPCPATRRPRLAARSGLWQRREHRTWQ